MSDANVEFVRRSIERFNRDGPDALVHVMHPESISYPFREWPEQSVYRGAEGAAKLAEEWIEQFDEYRWELKRLVDAGDAVVVLLVHRGRARGSGAETNAPIGAVFSDFRDGLVGRIDYFLTWEEALAHAGVADDEGGPGDG